jgi:phospholipid transport system transporter-binding protein
MSGVQLTSDGTLTISGSLNTDSVMRLWPEYQQDLNKVNQLTVDLSAIDHFDTAGLAWLLQLRGECEKQNIAFSLINTPENIISLADISQVKALLSL